MSATPNYRLPVKTQPAQPPAVWQQAAPVVIRGAALVAAGIIAEWMLRSAAKKAVSVPLGSKKIKAVAAKPATVPAVLSYTETIIVQRTITRR
jgi:hypothetical protein